MGEKKVHKYHVTWECWIEAPNWREAIHKALRMILLDQRRTFWLKREGDLDPRCCVITTKTTVEG